MAVNENEGNTDLSGPFAPIHFQTNTREFLFDTGSEVNLLSAENYKELTEDWDLKKLKKYSKNLCSVNGQELKVFGRVNIEIEFLKQNHGMEFVILDEQEVAIIGMNGMEQMKVVIDTENKVIRTNDNQIEFDKGKIRISAIKETKPNF